MGLDLQSFKFTDCLYLVIESLYSIISQFSQEIYCLAIDECGRVFCIISFMWKKLAKLSCKWHIFVFIIVMCKMDMAGAHTEAVLNKLSKPDLVQLILNTEANLGSQIAKLTTESKTC